MDEVCVRVFNEVFRIVVARIAGNEAAADEETHALVTRGIESAEVARSAVYTLTGSTFDESAEGRAAALNLLEDMISGCPTRAGVISRALWRGPCSSKEMWRASLSRLTEVAVRYPSVTEGVILAALSLHGDDEEWAPGTNDEIFFPWKKAARETVDELMLRCPLLTKQVLMRRHEDNDVRKGAMHQYGRLFPSCPEESDDILSLVLEGCSESSREIREVAICQLSAALVACPKRAREVIDALLSAGQDLFVPLKSAAISQFSAAVEAVQESSEEFLEALYSAVDSPIVVVQQAALQQLPKVAKLCRNKSREIVKVFLEKYLSVSSKVRANSVEGFPVALQACPEMGKEIVDVLLRFRHDSCPFLRAGVAKVLGGLVTGVPEDDDLLVSTLLRSCRDEHFLVRVAAIRQLVPLGKKLSQASVKCARALFQASERNITVGVRCEALRQLGAAAEAWPKLTSRIVHLILCQFCGGVRLVCEEGVKQLTIIIRTRPEEAIGLLRIMLDHEEEGSPCASGAKRKRRGSPCAEGVMKKRCESCDSSEAPHSRDNNERRESVGREVQEVQEVQEERPYEDNNSSEDDEDDEMVLE